MSLLKSKCSKEFFSLVKTRLSKDGIVAIKIDIAPNYTVGAQNDLLAMLFRSLKDVYENVYTLPDNEVIYLASAEPVIFNINEVEQKYNQAQKYLIVKDEDKLKAELVELVTQIDTIKGA